MTYLLTSLFSVKDNAGGVGLFDTDDNSFKYLQILDLSNTPGRVKHIRGISCYKEEVFATTTWGVLVLGPGSLFKKHALKTNRLIIRPEWLLGQGPQANLFSSKLSPSDGNLYVGFNNHSAIDRVALDGELIDRRYLWEISPDTFIVPEKRPPKGSLRFGIVQDFFWDDNRGMIIDVSYINGQKMGGLINYETGELILNNFSFPVGGEIVDSHLFICDIDSGEIRNYDWPPLGTIDGEKRRIYTPSTDDNKWPKSIQKVRGLKYVDNKLFCGVCHYGKVEPTQIPPRLVTIDRITGTQLDECFIPSFEGFRDPQVYSIVKAPDWLAHRAEKVSALEIFFGNEQIQPEIEDPFDRVVQKDPIDQAKSTNPNIPIVSNSLCEAAKCDYPKEIKTSKAENPANDDELKTIADDNGHETCTGENQKGDIKEVVPDGPCDADTRIDGQLDEPTDAGGAIPSGNPAALKPPRPAIVLDDVSMCFKRKATSIFGLNRQLRKAREFWALKHVSFTVNEGELVGIIGRNGSGKSTLSMVCTGVYTPDKGHVTVHGRAQLLALGVGFKALMTGRENVFISASLMGVRHKDIKRLMPEIEDFADIGDFMDEPVRTYSSGMRSRLAFAVATAVKPDILILDEAMSVGDKAFRDKAVERMKGMRETAKCVMIVSHSSGQLRKLCDRVLWFERGTLFMDGDPKSVLKSYDNFCKNPQKWLDRNSDTIRIEEKP